MKELLRLGATPEQAEIVTVEVAAVTPRERGSLERDDFWIAALVCAWDFLQNGSGRSNAYLRVQMRGVLLDLLQRENRAIGRWPCTVRWPVFWPRHFAERLATRLRYRGGVQRPYCCDCGAFLEGVAPNTLRCESCGRSRRLEKQRANNAVYFAKRRAAAA